MVWELTGTRQKECASEKGEFLSLESANRKSEFGAGNSAGLARSCRWSGMYRILGDNSPGTRQVGTGSSTRTAA